MDRLSQLQEKVCELSRLFYTYIGVLQRDAPPSPLPPGLDATDFFGQGRTFAASIMETTGEIFRLIDSLPGIDQSEEAQLDDLKQIDEENEIYATKLREALRETDLLLAGIRAIIDKIAEDCRNDVSLNAVHPSSRLSIPSSSSSSSSSSSFSSTQ
uniref:Mediator of RNA polymerase II transcription subunit 21 n=1 Tax=Paramoeba aestuarina TaxID=180227 RepID=A0A7S4JWL1_9EUKA|mmetsp:Transcript_13618/g.21084  ORF Transcript_13618/g.21084 Transcript_13618/m.21084 type:complete len:156 (+) Transcript_13618:131-598(+)